MKHLIAIFISTILFYSCSPNYPIVIDQTQNVYPILKNKEYNHLLNLCITVSDTVQITNIESFIIDLKGTSYFENIESLSIYAMGIDSTFINSNSKVIATTTTIHPVVSLKSNTSLNPGKNYFWLSCKVKDNADLDNLIAASCQSIKTNKGNIKPKSLQNQIPLRFGYALRNEFDDNSKAHRIPGLVATNKGTLLASYDVRYEGWRDLQGHMDIGISRSTDGGNSWEPMQVALDMGTFGGLPEKFNGVSDACLLVDKNTDHIFLFGLWMHGVINDDGVWQENLTDTSTNWNHQWLTKGSQPGLGIMQTAQFIMTKSIDDGKTWSKPINLTKMCKRPEWWLWAPAPGAGITMKNGTLVIPTQGRDVTGQPFSNITFSHDNGETWKTSNAAYHNTTECAVVELWDGSLMLNMRDNRNWEVKDENNGRAIFTTNDMGETWAEHPSSHGALNEPTCMASLHRHDSLLFFSNPNTKDSRYNITIKSSNDFGSTWPSGNWILLDHSQGAGYSCLTSVDSNHIGIVYESGQTHLIYQRVRIN